MGLPQVFNLFHIFGILYLIKFVVFAAEKKCPPFFSKYLIVIFPFFYLKLVPGANPIMVAYFDQLFVCCVVVYPNQPLVGSLYTGKSYHEAMV